MKVIRNRNEELAREAEDAVRRNGGYCPCALINNPDAKCMCKDFRVKVQNGYIGECNCGLFETVED